MGFDPVEYAVIEFQGSRFRGRWPRSSPPSCERTSSGCSNAWAKRLTDAAGCADGRVLAHDLVRPSSGRGRLFRGAARSAVVTGTATALSGRVQRRRQRGFTEGEQESARANAEPPAQSAPAATAGDEDVLSRLERLGALRGKDAVPDEEFEAEKTKILGG